MLEETVKKILTARVYEAARETPISAATILSKRLNNQILIKREDLQPVYSFKIRGAYNKMAQLTEEQKAKGVIAASAGNHAQGLALAAKQLGVKAVIVMPRITPEIKVQAVRARGAKVVLRGDAFGEALAHFCHHPDLLFIDIVKDEFTTKVLADQQIRYRSPEVEAAAAETYNFLRAHEMLRNELVDRRTIGLPLQRGAVILARIGMIMWSGQNRILCSDR